MPAVNLNRTIDVDPATIAKWREIVRRDNPDGYELFYTLTFNRPLPRHGRNWTERIYKARAEGRGSIIRGFRSSTKTTIISNGFLAYQIGLYPAGCSMMIQASDPKADDNTAMVARIIESNPAWKLLFPEVVPDKSKGWGSAGYEVMRTDMDYGEWGRTRAKDPTFVGYGVTSSTIIGGHPDLLLIIDDINDEENTRSAKEIEHVNTKLRGTILPTSIEGKTWELVLCTPWKDNDAAATLAETGAYEVIDTPMFTVVDGPEAGAVFCDVLHPTDKDFRGKWLKLAWPDHHTLEVVQALRRKWGGVEFARMALLDLSKIKAGLFHWQSYPAQLVDPTWPVGGGADYAGTIHPSAGLDYFAHAYVAQPNQFGGVVVGGVWDRATQAQAERYLQLAQSLFARWIDTVLEGDGKGEEFFQVLMRNPGLRIRMMKTQNKSKHERLLRELGPVLENGIVRISDADTPFLNRLRDELEKWPGIDNEDCLDALYWALRGMPQIMLIPAATTTALPSPAGPAPMAANPFLGLVHQKLHNR